MAVVCKPLIAMCVHCSAVHHRWEIDLDYDVGVLYNINLLYDNITVQEIWLVFTCDTVVTSIPRMQSFRNYE